MQSLIWIVIAVTVVVVEIVIGIIVSRMNRPDRRPQYVETEELIGQEIAYRPDLDRNLTALQDLCNITKQCIGFNTGGYLLGKV